MNQYYLFGSVNEKFVFLRIWRGFRGSTAERTLESVQKVEDYFLTEQEDTIEHLFTVVGFSFAGSAQNAAFGFISLKDWEEREGDDQSVFAVAQQAGAALYQIKDAMIRVSGGIQWGGNQSLWEEYSDILGVPDYQNSQDEDRSPSIMFQKFLDDAATYTCQNWIEAEKSGESELLFVQDDEDISRSSVQENIRQFRWQIQGSPFRNTSEDQLLFDDYESLFFMIHQRTSSTTESWTGICIAMFTHPDFFYY